MGNLPFVNNSQVPGEILNTLGAMQTRMEAMETRIKARMRAMKTRIDVLDYNAQARQYNSDVISPEEFLEPKSRPRQTWSPWIS